MNLYDYVKKFNYTFEEKPFNEVDNLVFAVLSYLNFEGIVSFDKKNKITIQELSNKYYEKYPKYSFKEDITVKRYTFKIVKMLSESVRFKDVLVYNYCFYHDDVTQFGAVTFEGNDFIYVSFEGTDDYISGWHEDFEMAYNFPVSAHKRAISYLNKYIFAKKRLFVGGHSKGGNLALVSAMYTNFIVRNKIENIFSNDGPGLRLKEIESKKYDRVKNKLKHIIPHTSFIGLILRHENDVVVKTNAPTFFSHLPYTWLINDSEFIKTELSKSSDILNKGLFNWLNKYSYEEREEFVKALFKAFQDNNIISLNQFKIEPINVIKFLKSLMKVDNIVKDMSSDLIKVLTDTIKE